MDTAFSVGDTHRILGFDKKDKNARQRLLAMGLTPQTEFLVKRIAPLGDPIEIIVRGFSLSLRKAEAALLKTEVVR